MRAALIALLSFAALLAGCRSLSGAGEAPAPIEAAAAISHVEGWPVGLWTFELASVQRIVADTFRESYIRSKSRVLEMYEDMPADEARRQAEASFEAMPKTSPAEILSRQQYRQARPFLLLTSDRRAVLTPLQFDGRTPAPKDILQREPLPMQRSGDEFVLYPFPDKRPENFVQGMGGDERWRALALEIAAFGEWRIASDGALLVILPTTDGGTVTLRGSRHGDLLVFKKDAVFVYSVTNITEMPFARLEAAEGDAIE